MGAPSVEDMRQTIAAIEHYGSISGAARAKGLARQTVQSQYKAALKAAREGKLGTDAVIPGFEISRVSEGPRGKTIEQRPARGAAFQIPDGHAIKGVSAFVGADGRTIGQWIKTKEGERTPEETAQIIRKAFDGFSSTAADIPAPVSTDDTATAYPLADLHLGVLAWSKESGDNYDLRIAEHTVKEAMGRLFSSSPPSQIGIILGLGDLLHFDGYEPVTSRSRNILDVDGRYPLVLQTATSVLIWSIEQALRKHEQVIVRILPGNHDDQSAIAVSLALSMYYRESKRVAVDCDPSRFWWWRFGVTFVGATHGDMTKMQDLPLVMASARPADWGSSQHRYLWTGHIHHKSAIKEVGNVIVESFRSPAARDAWHAASGYVSGRSLTSITLHRAYGEISRQTANIVGAV